MTTKSGIRAAHLVWSELILKFFYLFARNRYAKNGVKNDTSRAASTKQNWPSYSTPCNTHGNPCIKYFYLFYDNFERNKNIYFTKTVRVYL